MYLFTAKEKLQILKVINSTEIIIVCRRYKVHRATIWRWKKQFDGTFDSKKGTLVISGGGTTHTAEGGAATLASAELRNVASGIKNVNVTAGSDTAVYVMGDQRNGNALTINGKLADLPGQIVIKTGAGNGNQQSDNGGNQRG